MTKVTIRPIRPEDQAEWRRLWTDYLTFYESSVPAAVYATSFARLMGDDPHDYHGLIAECDGKPCG